MLAVVKLHINLFPIKLDIGLVYIFLVFLDLDNRLLGVIAHAFALQYFGWNVVNDVVNVSEFAFNPLEFSERLHLLLLHAFTNINNCLLRMLLDGENSCGVSIYLFLVIRYLYQFLIYFEAIIVHFPGEIVNFVI